MTRAVISFVSLLFTTTVAAEVVFLGVGSSTGLITNTIDMNDICRRTFSVQETDFGEVRWASTRDYREASNRQGWGGEPAHLSNFERVAFRAEDTIFTQDGRAYDQATGALEPLGKKKYPGAVIVAINKASFANRNARANPMCVHGRPRAD
jgi:hypothetical protein